MALLDLTTDLKSLRYGKDRIGGGSSKEPFVTKSVNSSPGDTGGPDFLLRANTLSKTGNDLSRLGKFFISPKGLQFAAKQNLLSRTGVRIQSNSDISFNPINDGVYLPTSTLAQAAVNAEGGHLLKQGLNPFRNTSQTGANTGIGIIDNILNAELPLDQPLYIRRVNNQQPIDQNRLTNLVDTKIGVSTSDSNNNPIDSFLGQITGGGIGGFFGGIFNNLFKPVNSKLKKGLSISQNANEILRYNGGPGSALGIGQTSIKRVIDSQEYNTEIFKKNNYLLNYSSIIGKLGEGVYNNDARETLILPDFRKDLLSAQNEGNKQNILASSLDYNNPKETLGGRVNMGDPGRRGRNLRNYNIGVTDKNGNPSGPLDKINALPLYQSPQMISKTSVINDLVKFRIGILDNNSKQNNKTYIHFRSFIDSFSDNYSADWSSQKFMGRAENFYRYGGFDRQIQMSWTVAALSVDELIPMYQKLNFLASSLAPDYSSQGYMQGNIAYLTMGGYCYEQPGIITGLNLSPPQEATYEIDIESSSGANDGGIKTKELAHIIKVTGFTFIPIHNFVPRIQSNSYFGQNIEGGGGNYISSFGKERYIALKNAKNNNYTQNNFTKPKLSDASKTSNSSNNINKTETSQGLNTSNPSNDSNNE